MKIALIKPGMGSLIEGYNFDEGRMEPLQLGILAALVPELDEVALYDDRMEDIPYSKKIHLACITIHSYTARRAYEIARKFRKIGVRVVLGGVHVTLLPEEASKHADAIVIGDAENVFKQVIEDARKDKLKKVYSSEFGIPQMGIVPKRELFKGKGYLPISLVQFSRGCKFNCSFCSVSKFFRKSHHCRNVDDVIMEIESQGLRRILFVDDNLVTNRKKAKELMRRLIPLKIKWASQSSIDMVKDTDLMDLMVKSGCVGHLIGFESLNVNSLKWLNKNINARNFDEYQKALKILRNYGFQIWGSFIIGNDFDNLETINKTVEFAIKSKLALAWFHVLMPYPGTKVFDRFKEQDRLLFDGHWWNHKDFKYHDTTFVPKLMSPKELTKAAIQANKDFYSLSSISRRLFDLKTNFRNPSKFMTYLRLNQIVRSTST